jgi:UDP-perosamine 4-acetyltransferase
LKIPVLVIGAGGHAKILIDIIHESNEYYIEAVIGQKNENIDNLMGHKVLKGDEYLEQYKKKGINNVVIGIGGYRDNKRRQEIFNNLSSKGFNIVNLIHPSAVISSSVKLGEGVVIFAGVILNAEVEIGDNVIIATGSTIDHESIIKSHVLISAGVTIGAGNIISEGALLALGSKVISRVSIGKNALVAAGSVVVSDVDSDTVIYGVPGKPKLV